MRTLVIVLLLAIGCCFPKPGFAAFKSASDRISPEQACNPRPSQDDIILPMPCGLSMALRPVAIPAGALLRDKTFTMGVSESQNQARQLYERQFTGHIAAPFTVHNLPPAWRDKLGGGFSQGDTFYFIGKYEVSGLQWNAVMLALDANGQENETGCPVKTEPGGNLPASGISWFEAQEFLNKYNAWLVKNHASSLPAFEGTQNIAFLRLPTEEEWEYAARGGTKVPPEWWVNKDFFPLGEGKSLKDYGVFQQGATPGGPSAIGSRNPNPLGLHDTIGNVRELVDGFFHMSIADMRNGQVERRLHGAAGGILTKGGGFRDGQDAIMPGWRDEVPLYTTSGPSRPADLGFRLALAGLNIPNAQRLEELRQEERHSAAGHKAAEVKINTAQSPLEAIDALAESADAGMKSNLRRLRAMLEDHLSAEARANAKNLEHSFRSLLYQSETLRAFAFRYSSANKEMEKIRAMLAKPMDAANRARANKILFQAEEDISDYLRSLEMGANYYRTSLEAICQTPVKELRRLFTQARQEYGGEGIFNAHMLHNLDILEKFLALAREKGMAAISQKDILKGLLPSSHYKALPF